MLSSLTCSLQRTLSRRHQAASLNTVPLLAANDLRRTRSCHLPGRPLYLRSPNFLHQRQGSLPGDVERCIFGTMPHNLKARDKGGQGATLISGCSAQSVEDADHMAGTKAMALCEGQSTDLPTSSTTCSHVWSHKGPPDRVTGVRQEVRVDEDRGSKHEVNLDRSELAETRVDAVEVSGAGHDSRSERCDIRKPTEGDNSVLGNSKHEAKLESSEVKGVRNEDKVDKSQVRASRHGSKVDKHGIRGASDEAKVVRSKGCELEARCELGLPTFSHLRRPSWFSDSTYMDVESSSSEDYREIPPHQRPSSFSQSSSYSSWIERPISEGRRARQPSVSSSNNEADDEVEGDSDGGTCYLTSRSSGAHLYQELPDVQHPGHAHCTLCSRPPHTPPQLPPRCDMQSPVPNHLRQGSEMHHRRGRSVSETLHNTTFDGSSSNMAIRRNTALGNKLSRRDNADDKIKSSDKESKRMDHEMIYHGEGTDSKDHYISPLVSSPRQSGAGKLRTGQSQIEDPVKRVSVFSGLYQDIDTIESTAEQDRCSCNHTDERPQTPPEPPPRNKDSRHFSQRHGEYYEDLDRFRKNLHKYLGIPVRQVNSPPPLPDRPLSLPAVSQVRQRPKYKFKSLGRKKKSQSLNSPTTNRVSSTDIPASGRFGSSTHVGSSTQTGSSALTWSSARTGSSVQTTDDNMSVDAFPHVQPVSAWPFKQNSLSRQSRFHRLVSDNSFYSSREEFKARMHAGKATQSDDPHHASFRCGTCGATNHLYANVPPMVLQSPEPYQDNHRPGPTYPRPRTAYPRPCPPHLPPAYPGHRHSYRDPRPTRSPQHMPDPFSELLSTSPPPWHYDEDTERKEMMWADHWSEDWACDGTWGRKLPSEQQQDTQSDLYTDMSGALQDLYMPMESPHHSSQPSDHFYVNWPLPSSV